jgi:hypothetical protein
MLSCLSLCVLLYCCTTLRYVKFKGEHNPTADGIASGAKSAKLKIKLVGGLLKLAGKEREYRALKMGFKAFSVHNSMAYGKSFVCAVDNGRALMNQMLEKEKSSWRCVWQEAPCMSWEAYGDTFQAGVRRLLFRMESPTNKKTLHNFKYVQAAKPSVLKLGLKKAASTDSGSSRRGSSSSSSRASQQAGSAASTPRSNSSSSQVSTTSSAAEPAVAQEVMAAAGARRSSKAVASPKAFQPEAIAVA